MKLHVASSTAVDPNVAARETAARALGDAKDPVFALVLATDGYDANALARAVNDALGPVPWAGCSGAGVFAGGVLFEQGLVVGVLSARDVALGIGVGGPVSRDSRGAGRDAVREAIASVRPTNHAVCRTIVAFADVLAGSAAEVVRGGAEEAGAGVVWAGGGAGDNLRDVRAAQFAHGVAHRDSVVAIAIDTPRRVALGIRHGFTPYGAPRLVTRASGSAAIELEFEPAFDVYRNTAAARGDHVDAERFAAFAMTHPLGIPQPNGEHVIRDPLAVESDGSLRCVADVPDGSLVRVMQADRTDLIAAAERASMEARARIDGAPGGALVFDCVSRAKLLGPDIRNELAAIQNGIGADVPMMGCLTFGEFGGRSAAAPQFLNKTTVVLAVPE